MRIWHKLLLASALALAATSEAARSAGAIDPTTERKVDEFVRDEMGQQHVPGVAVAIVQQSNVIAKGYGYANVEHQVPVTDKTIFQSGSLGKMFTSTVVMLLVEDGKLALTHTSGIPDYTTSSFDYRKDYTEDELAHLAFKQTLEFPAGARWNYSNTG